MRIAIDAREAFSKHPTGKGMWAKHVLDELEKHNEVSLTLYTNEYRVARRSSLVARATVTRATVTRATSDVFWHWKTAWNVWRKKPDVYLSTTSYIVPWLLGRSVPTVIVIHDLIAFDGDPHDRKATVIERALLPRVLKTARWIFCVSEATKHDLLTHFPKTDPSKITVIYAGPTVKLTTNNYKLITTAQNPQTLKPSNPYILLIGTLCPRKNQLRLIQAFNALPHDLKRTYRLILAGGRGWDDQEIVDLAARSENVEWRGYVPENELIKLLKNALLLAYPSIKEGFGFPILDAMTLGVPVLTSKGTSMAEIAGGAAELVDNPRSVEEMAKKLEHMLIDTSMRKMLIEKGMELAEGFSWEKMVDEMLKTMTSSSH